MSSAIVWVSARIAPDKVDTYKPNILSGVHGDWLVERTQRNFILSALVAELAERAVKLDCVQV